MARFLLGLGFLLLLPRLAVAQPTLLLTSVENGSLAETIFACSGRIHGYLLLPQRVQGHHVMEGRWFGPDGKIVQDATIPLELSAPGKQLMYLWFSFDEPTHWLGGLANLDQQAWNGTWRVDVQWDEHPLLSQKFDVRC